RVALTARAAHVDPRGCEVPASRGAEHEAARWTAARMVATVARSRACPQGPPRLRRARALRFGLELVFRIRSGHGHRAEERVHRRGGRCADSSCADSSRGARRPTWVRSPSLPRCRTRGGAVDLWTAARMVASVARSRACPQGPPRLRRARALRFGL